MSPPKKRTQPYHMLHNFQMVHKHRSLPSWIEEVSHEPGGGKESHNYQFTSETNVNPVVSPPFQGKKVNKPN